MRDFLLALLARSPAHGYDLKQAYDALFADVWQPINIGQVYTTLSRLERDGLVEATEVEQADRPAKKVYALTELGVKAVAGWLGEAPTPAAPRTDLVLRLVAAQLTGLVPLGELVARQRAELLGALRQLEVLVTTTHADDVARLLVEGSALHLQADLRWLERCDEVLRPTAVLSPDPATAPPPVEGAAS
jgi:DNA-binding PadR family transcriptional regulator